MSALNQLPPGVRGDFDVRGLPICRVEPFPSEAVGEVEPIDTNTPPPKPDDAMFYGLVGDVARTATQDTEVNPVAAAAVFLSFLGANVGRDVYHPIGNVYHHARVFTLHIGRSSRGGKGDSQGLTHRIRKRVEETYSGLLGQTHTGGLSTREGLALMIHDGFKQGKEEFLPIDDKRLWVVESEFANVLHQAKRDGNTLSAALREVWDGGSIKPAIKTSRVWASRPHIGLHCCITPNELLNLLESRELSNGFANRFLMIWAENVREVPFPQPTPKHVLDELAARTGSVIAFAKGNYPAEQNTRQMILTDDASRLFAKVYGPELRRPIESEILSSLIERRAPYARRLAMLFALTDRSLLIEEKHLKSALAWVRYAVDSVRFVFSEKSNMAGAEEQADIARKIVAFLEERKGGADRTQIYRECFGSHVSSGKIGAALKTMLSANPPRIELVEQDRADGKSGRKRNIYRALCASSANKDTARAVGNFHDCAISALRSPGSGAGKLTAQTAQTEKTSVSPVGSLTAQSAQTAQSNIESADVIEVNV